MTSLLGVHKETNWCLINVIARPPHNWMVDESSECTIVRAHNANMIVRRMPCSKPSDYSFIPLVSAVHTKLCDLLHQCFNTYICYATIISYNRSFKQNLCNDDTFHMLIHVLQHGFVMQNFCGIQHIIWFFHRAMISIEFITYVASTHLWHGILHA